MLITAFSRRYITDQSTSCAKRSVESDYLYRKAFSWLKIPKTIFIISLFLFQMKINPHKLLRKMK